MPRNKKSATATGSSESAAPALAAAQQEPVEAVESTTETSDPTQSASAFGKQESSGRIRGPVEEVIAKRVRTLGKKIQRFRAYSAQPVEKLNADQKAAIASLPILEAQSRELEDLIKSGGAVEVAELGESAKLRGLKEEVEAKARTDAESASGSYHTNLATPLSRFLNLYTLLHPARSADHEHLTFSPLDLPSQLQDEVRATDVLRVGKMWEELLGGGEKAGEVLAGLTKGSMGVDEENDHIHQLLDLLAQGSSSAGVESSEPTAEETTDADAENQPESTPALGTADAADEEDDEPKVIEADPTAPIEESTATLPNGHSESKGSSKGALNFLQEDELDAGTASMQDEGFEMVESAAPHETEHYDVPTPAKEESTPVAVVEEPSKPAFDWADEHDEPSSAVAETPKAEVAEAEGSASASAEASASASTPAPADKAESSTPPASGGRGGRGGRGRGGPGGRGRGGNRQNQNQGQGQGQTETGQVGLPIPPKPAAGKGQGQPQGQGGKAGVVVDEDGFEMKVKPSARGRGGPGGGRGGGGGGRGGGEGGYRGGRGRGGGEGQRGGRGGFQKPAGGAGEGQQRPSKPTPAPTAQA